MPSQNKMCSLLFSLADDFRRGHARFHQSAEEQVPLEEVLRQTSAAGLPARADGLRGRQYGNVSDETLCGDAVFAAAASQKPTWLTSLPLKNV